MDADRSSRGAASSSPAPAPGSAWRPRGSSWSAEGRCSAWTGRMPGSRRSRAIGAVPFRADVTRPGDRQRLLDAAEGIDGLVLAHGETQGQRIDEVTEADWDRLHAANLGPSSSCSRRSRPGFRTRRDRDGLVRRGQDGHDPRGGRLRRRQGRRALAHALVRDGTRRARHARQQRPAGDHRHPDAAPVPGVQRPHPRHHARRSSTSERLRAIPMRRAGTPDEAAEVILFLLSRPLVVPDRPDAQRRRRVRHVVSGRTTPAHDARRRAGRARRAAPPRGRGPIPEPGPGEVRIRIEACGVCGSDVFLQKGGFGRQGAVADRPRARGRRASSTRSARGSRPCARRPGRPLLHHGAARRPRGRPPGGPTSAPT